jgi:hypothetical protein
LRYAFHMRNATAFTRSGINFATFRLISTNNML